MVRELEGGSRPADERPGVPPGPGVVLPLPAAADAQPCPGVEQQTVAEKAPQPFPPAIFTRPRTEADAVPALTGADSCSWIPAGTIFLDAARRPSPDQFDAELHLVPIAEPRQGGRCDGDLDAVLGVCLVAGAGDAAVRCFTDEDVEAGRAIALTSPGVVHGIVPDGVGRVTLHAGGATVAADVHENAYEIRAPVAAGERIRLQLERTEECRPSSELLEAVPALRDSRWETLSAPAEDAMSSVRQWARAIETGDTLELWVVARCDSAERACVVAIHGGSWAAQQCATVREIRQHGTSLTFPVAGGLAVAGIAPPRMRRAQAVSGEHVHDLQFTGGVYGGLLPPEFGDALGGDEGSHVRLLRCRTAGRTVVPLDRRPRPAVRAAARRPEAGRRREHRRAEGGRRASGGARAVRARPGRLARPGTVALGSHLERLAPELREPFVDAVIAELDEPVVDYVRLNILARRPS